MIFSFIIRLKDVEEIPTSVRSVALLAHPKMVAIVETILYSPRETFCICDIEILGLYSTSHVNASFFVRTCRSIFITKC